MFLKNKLKKLAFLLIGFVSTSYGQTTYNDVAEIFYTHCSFCHHNGGGAPMSLMSYYETSFWTTSISGAIQGKNGVIMPPWHADTAYTIGGKTGSRFLEENTLSPSEINKILQWISDGVLEGDPNLLPTAPKYGDVTYRLNGIADLTVEAPLFRSNATDAESDAYNCFTVPSSLTEDRWLRAYEIIPGNKDIEHHVFVNVDSTGTVATDSSGNCLTPGGQILLGTWIAGAAPTIFPSDSSFRVGVRIPKGSNFIFNIHYRPGSGGELDDHTKIRLFFYPKGTAGIRPVHTDVFLQQWDPTAQFFGNPSIPKNQTVKHIGLSTNFSPDIGHKSQPSTAMTILAAGGHSHYICSKIKIYASLGADTVPVLRINDWNVNWQRSYWYPKPLKIPAGYILKSEHIYNNTVSNPHLLGPPVDTYFGAASIDNEMLYDSFIWLDYQTGDEEKDMVALVANDPLLKVGIPEIEEQQMEAHLYPNPASDEISILLKNKSVFQIRLLSLAGQVILETEGANEQLNLNVKNISNGLYILEIVDLNTDDQVSKKVSILH